MNCYIDSARVLDLLGLGASQESYALVLAEAASRAADQMAGRHFFTETGTRVYNGTLNNKIVIHDLLTLTSAYTDPDRDETYSDAWVEDTDFVLDPQHEFPKTSIRRKLGTTSDFYLGGGYIAWLKLTGIWGAGNLRDEVPWETMGITGTVANGTSTSITVSSGTSVNAGMTLLLGTEQVFVESKQDHTLTVKRGVNGTTAAAHSSATVYLAQYPAEVVRGVDAVTVMLYRQTAAAGLQSETIKNYSYTFINTVHEDRVLRRIFNGVRREPWF